MSTKYSCKREALKEVLANRFDHPTAEEIYFSLKAIHPNISLATVYRNLNLLVSEGEILRLTSKGNADHFDGDTRPHYHFYCDECGAISDVNIPIFTELNGIADSKMDAEVKGHTIMFHGICSKCQKEKRK